MAYRNEEVKTQYIEWLCLTDRTRRAWKMPLTESEFASQKGVTTRNMRRWKSDEDFKLKWRQREQEIAQQAGAYVPKADVSESKPHRDPRSAAKREKPDPPEDIDRKIQREAIEQGHDEQRAEYESIKASISQQARDGDAQAVEKWMKWWGQPFADEERAEREAQFADLDDDELAAQTLELIGMERVAEWLEAKRSMAEEE